MAQTTHEDYRIALMSDEQKTFFTSYIPVFDTWGRNKKMTYQIINVFVNMYASGRIAQIHINRHRKGVDVDANWAYQCIRVELNQMMKWYICDDMPLFHQLFQESIEIPEMKDMPEKVRHLEEMFRECVKALAAHIESQK